MGTLDLRIKNLGRGTNTDRDLCITDEDQEVRNTCLVLAKKYNTKKKNTKIQYNYYTTSFHTYNT